MIYVGSPSMVSHGADTIINVSSQSAATAIPGFSSCSASKLVILEAHEILVCGLGDRSGCESIKWWVR